MEEFNNVNNRIEMASIASDSPKPTDEEIAFQESVNEKEEHAPNKEDDCSNLEKTETVAETTTSLDDAIDNKTECNPASEEITDSASAVVTEVKKEEAENNAGTDEETLPPIILSDPSSGYKNGISVFCISQQGESHINNNVPCQDRSEFRWVNDQLCIAAIADGVGSCQLSEYGAETAVKSSLDFLEQFFKVAMKQDKFIFDTPDMMKTQLSGAMQHAYDEVEKKAEELNVLSYSLQSTLTVAAYDGTTLYFAHAGDDGIVALNKEGTYAMVTSRIKGEEASSVFPLQSKQWFYGKVNDTVAFVMATDGVLDAFVRPASENNRVYYRFIEPVFYTSQIDEESAKSNCNDWDEYLKSTKYRNVVTDDITFVGVVNQKAILHSKKPVFDDKAWNDQTAEYEKKRRAALYPPQSPKTSDKKKKESDARTFGYGRKSTVDRTKFPSIPTGSSAYQSPRKANNTYPERQKNSGYSSYSDYPQNLNDSRRKPVSTDSRDMIVNGAKQTFAGMVDLTAGVTATVFEASGQVFSAVGEMHELAAEKIKQDRMHKNQQKSSTSNNRYSSGKTDK